MRVQTNDPDRSWLEVVITGVVEPFAEIRPKQVNLLGAVGKPLSAEIEIMPRAEQPFTIQGISARNGTFITYALTQRCSESKDRCIISVENTRSSAGRYADVLTVATDSPLKPVIPIFIVGRIE